jgi:hypothetical protein
MTSQDIINIWPSVTARHVVCFIEIEQRLGFQLPPDFKDLLTVFGLGGFGELSLFHPDGPSDMLRLPEAVWDSHALFQVISDYVNRRLPADPTDNLLILGMLMPRSYLLWDSISGWEIYDTEMSRAVNLGSDLRVFLWKAYSDWLNSCSGLHSVVAYDIWGDFKNTSIRPFFECYG